MATKKKTESVDDKRKRLEPIRERIKIIRQWFTRFHPEGDEVPSLLNHVSEWAKLDELNLSEEKLARAAKDSIFPRLIQFCKDELSEIVTYCENCLDAQSRIKKQELLDIKNVENDKDIDAGVRKIRIASIKTESAKALSLKGTLRETDINLIRLISQVDDLESLEENCKYLRNVDIADVLVRIMLSSYRAQKNPGTLNDLSISELRGDIFEVIAKAYSDINKDILDEAERGVAVGLIQVKTTVAAKDEANKKLTGKQELQLEVAAQKLRTKYPDWSILAIATELHKDQQFSSLSVSSLRQNRSVTKFKKIAKAKGSVKM